MAMVRPTVRVTLFHARRSATIQSVPTAASTTSFVYIRAVCMRASFTPSAETQNATGQAESC
eukprot:6211840-Pleurochrysis_carterae.AAC.3